MGRLIRTNIAKLITTLRGPNGCYASRYSRTEGRLCTNENSFRIHSKTTGWFCNVHSRTTPATIFSAVLRSINAPRKSATIKTTTIWFFSDIGFSFLTASEGGLPLEGTAESQKVWVLPGDRSLLYLRSRIILLQRLL